MSTPEFSLLFFFYTHIWVDTVQAIRDAMKLNKRFGFTGSSLLFIHSGTGLKSARKPEIKMIDFAHVTTHTPEKGQVDKGYLAGLDTLIRWVPCNSMVGAHMFVYPICGRSQHHSCYSFTKTGTTTNPHAKSLVYKRTWIHPVSCTTDSALPRVTERVTRNHFVVPPLSSTCSSDGTYSNWNGTTPVPCMITDYLAVDNAER